ncbi:kunitz trypsin inhibitor 2-like [Solanum pennellii]|uniref:Kunitz trypsin inhibitor 2-like n=1 Tax=Solanum pennellii TaxID=28526 RepID=A0ABM1GCS7_SOLPN|nr:kunitz trypsin inhibitor 2-like [Solanum pennellii]
MALRPFLVAIILSTSFIFLVKAQNISELVFDISGNPLVKGSQYFIVPVSGRSNEGGLDVSSIRNTVDTLVVTQNAQSSAGNSLRFTPVDSNENIIRLSIDLNVKFMNIIFSDNMSTVWTINTRLIPQRNLVSVGGVEGNPGRDTLGNWFKIDKYEEAYKFVYCPGVCETCRPFCGDIGILVEPNNKRVLFVGSDKPLKVTFENTTSVVTVTKAPPTPSASDPHRLSTMSFINVVMCIVIGYLTKLM